MKLILIITLLATLLRLYIFFDFAPACCGSDEGIYHKIAINFLQTGEMFITQENEPRLWKDIIYGAKPPFYSFFLANIYKITGPNYNAARIIQIFISAITGIFIYLITKELFSKKIGIIALILYSFFLEIAFMSIAILSENIYWFLISILIYLLIRIKKYGARLEIFAGFTLGLLILTRPTAIVFFPIITIWLLWKNFNKQSIKLFLIFTLFLFITLIPWNLRNYKIYEQFVFSYTDGGINIWMGNHAISIGNYNIPKLNDPNQTPILKTEGVKQEIERDNFYYKQSFEYMKHNPARAFDVATKKIFGTFSLYRQPMINITKSRGEFILIRPKTFMVDSFLEFLITYQYAIFVISFLLSIFYLIKIKNLNIFTSFPLLLIVGNLASIAVSHYELRYIMQLYPLMIPFSALIVHLCWIAIFGKNKESIKL